MNFQSTLFGFFGSQEKREDSYKDADKRGLKERFMRCLGAEYDEALTPLIDNFVANVIDPRTALARFVPYQETMMGVNYQVSNDLRVRRKLVAFSTRITRIKGTKRSYEILLKLMGFQTVNIVEYFPISGFDSPLTLDDPERRYDGRCAGCTNYDIELTGGMPIDADVRTWIRSVVAYCEPINAKLREIRYNGFSVPLSYVLFRVNDEGDLIYDNSASPRTTVRLVNGDLLIRGSNSSRYTLSSQGDLLYY